MAPCRKDKRPEEVKAIEDAAPKKTRTGLEDESTAQKVLQPSLQQTMADVEAIQKLASAAKRKADVKGGASASSGATSSAPESTGFASSAPGGRQRP